MDQHDFPDDTDLATLARLRADLPPPTEDAVLAARSRLAAAMCGATVTRFPAPRRAATRTRYLRRASVGVAAAVALGLGAYTLTGQDPAPGGQAAGPSTRAVAPSTARHTPAPRFATVAQLLDAASTGALNSLAPAGRYLRTTSHSRDTTSVDDPPDDGAYVFSENRSDTWLPGTAGEPAYVHDVNNISVTVPTAKQRRYVAGLPGSPTPRSDAWYRVNADGSQTQVFPAGGTDPACTGDCGSATAWEGASPQSVAALPTAVATLRASLFGYANKLHVEATKYGKPTTASSIALRGIGTVIGSGYAGAELRSALYQVAKTIPGITLNGSMANFDGVRGVAVSLTDPFDVQLNLIFAPDGSAYLGVRAVVVHPSAQYQLPAGTVVTWTAVRTEVTGKPALPKGARD